MNIVEIAQVHEETRTPKFQLRSLALYWQLFRFLLVGGLNSVIDIVVLNILVFAFPTGDARLLFTFNALSYGAGALNSFVLNKYWTFKQQRKTTAGELLRFVLINGAAVLVNSGVFWLVETLTRSLITNTFLWTNASKGVAVLVTALLSYSGMRFLVFIEPAKGNEVLPEAVELEEVSLKPENSLANV